MNVIIYTKNNCSYCANAKSLMLSKGIQYKELKLNEDFTREGLLDMFPSAKTFPVIVVDGMNIGGYNELRSYLTEELKDKRKFLDEGYWNGA